MCTPPKPDYGVYIEKMAYFAPNVFIVLFLVLPQKYRLEYKLKKWGAFPQKPTLSPLTPCLTPPGLASVGNDAVKYATHCVS